MLQSDKDRSTWIDSYYKPSLIRINDNDSSDFFNVKEQEGSFVHVLELLDEQSGETDELETVVS